MTEPSISWVSPTAFGPTLDPVTEPSISCASPIASAPIFDTPTEPFISLDPSIELARTLAPVTEPFPSLAFVTAPFRILAEVTAAFFSCFVPTWLTAKAEPPRATNRATSATTIDGEGGPILLLSDFLTSPSSLGQSAAGQTPDRNCSGTGRRGGYRSSNFRASSSTSASLGVFSRGP